MPRFFSYNFIHRKLVFLGQEPLATELKLSIMDAEYPL